MKLYMFRTVPLSIIRSFSQVCRQLLSRILLNSCLQTCMTYTIAVCTVKNSWWWTEELSKTCRLSFQNKFVKLVHLVGFIKKICHDAWSNERQIQYLIFAKFSKDLSATIMLWFWHTFCWWDEHSLEYKRKVTKHLNIYLVLSLFASRPTSS